MLNPSDRAAIVTELLKHVGGTDKQNTIKNFLNALAENNRLGVLPGVCEKFEKLMSAYHGEVELTVTSASVCHTTSFELRVPCCLQLTNDIGRRLWTAGLSPAWKQPLPNRNTWVKARN